MRRTPIAVLFVAVIAICVTALRTRAAESPDLKPMLEKYWQAWEKGPDAAAPLYAKDPNLVFYDLEPLKYVGWNQYKAGVVPNIISKFDSIKFTLNDDVKTTASGKIAWTSSTVKGDGALKGGSPIHVVMRHTAIWEKGGNDWVIVHEHVSVPSSLPAPGPPKS
jgi:ketosteroid isomerase-like protein